MFGFNLGCARDVCRCLLKKLIHSHANSNDWTKYCGLSRVFCNSQMNFFLWELFLWKVVYHPDIPFIPLLLLVGWLVGSLNRDWYLLHQAAVYDVVAYE